MRSKIIMMLLSVTVCASQDCSNLMQKLKCIPVKKGQTCLSNDAIDGSNMTWIESSDVCSGENGRLPWLGQGISLQKLKSTAAKHGKFSAIRIGLLYNMKKQLFWQNEMQTCKPVNSTICALGAVSSQCSTLGCCDSGNQCHYPGSYSAVTYTINTTIDTSGIRSTDHVSCVGIEKAANGTWFWKAYNCTEKPVLATAYFCEYKCGNAWPEAQSSTLQFDETTSGTYHDMTTSGTYGRTTLVTSNKPQNNSAVKTSRIYDSVQMLLLIFLLIISTAANLDC
ncbi:uncharacterized protein LOC128554260 [Mercenaria mercenaria]|uniref:uncharacterized protein LOC128554260 n=1 Tax=Mercenaria mercenaria TaxID=6596 RepID=UPI00234F618C|nr:uncharacterized protein LOC128554260 [Mercenaria mercenaria]